MTNIITVTWQMLAWGWGWGGGCYFQNLTPSTSLLWSSLFPDVKGQEEKEPPWKSTQEATKLPE